MYPKIAWNDALDAKLRLMRENKVSWAGISQAFNTSDHAVRMRARRIGLPVIKKFSNNRPKFERDVNYDDFRHRLKLERATEKFLKLLAEHHPEHGLDAAGLERP